MRGPFRQGWMGYMPLLMGEKGNRSSKTPLLKKESVGGGLDRASQCVLGKLSFMPYSRAFDELILI